MLCLHKATLSIVGRFHRISLTSIHFTPFMVMELILLRKFKKCQEIFGWLQYMPFCSICAVFHSISMSTYSSCEICTHFTWSKLIKIPMHIKSARYHEIFIFWQFRQFCSIRAVFHNIVRSHCKENMVWISSASKQTTCSKFW